MDIPRPEFRQKRRIKTVIYSSAVGVVVIAATIALSRLEPAAPSVPRESVYFGTVRQGEMLVQRRGPGNLVPREIRWIPAQTAGRICGGDGLPDVPAVMDVSIKQGQGAVLSKC